MGMSEVMIQNRRRGFATPKSQDLSCDFEPCRVCGVFIPVNSSCSECAVAEARRKGIAANALVPSTQTGEGE